MIYIHALLIGGLIGWIYCLHNYINKFNNQVIDHFKIIHELVNKLADIQLKLAKHIENERNINVRND